MAKAFTLEHDIQCAFIEWVRWQEKKDKRLRTLFAVPNGGHRSISTATALKKEGVRAGVPDIMFPLAVGEFNGLAIEFKSQKGRLSDSQRDFIDRLMQCGWRVYVCYSADQAIDCVERYLADGRKEVVP